MASNFDYFYYVNGSKQGPVKQQQLRELASQGKIRPHTLIESVDGQNQFPARQLSDMPFRSSGIFDIGFTRFISNTWISIIWGIVIAVHFLVAIGATIYSFNVESPLPFLIALFAVPISLLSWRLALELDVIFFRIETNTRESKEHLREIKELLAQK